MGVPGIWKLLESTGKPVTLESLQGKILAIDLSLWIHQAMKGCAGRSNEKNGHLIVLFNRIAKLLFYGVKPIFVFDGPNVPEFKKIVLSKRQMKRAEALQKLSSVQRKILHKLAAEAVSSALNSSNNDVKNRQQSLKETCEKNVLEGSSFSESTEYDYCNSSEEEDVSELSEIIDVPLDYDLNSKQFLSLPATIQYDILLTMTSERAKVERYNTVLPENSDDFSRYQLRNLLKKSQINEKLEQVQKDLVASDPIFNLLPETTNYHIKSIYHSDQRRHLILKSEADEQMQNIEVPNEEVPEKVQELQVFDKDSSSCSDQTLPNIKEADSNSNSNFFEPEKLILPALDKNLDLVVAKSLELDPKIEIELRSEEHLPNLKPNFIEKTTEDNILEIDDKSDVEDNSNLNLPAKSPLGTSNTVETTQSNKNEKTIESDDDDDDDDSFVEVAEVSPTVAHHLLDVSFVDPLCDTDDSVCPSTSVPHNINHNVMNTFSSQHSEENTDYEYTKESLEELRAQRQKAEAVDKSLSSQIMEECEAVLKLFGIPFIRSPGEAEAQCAAIEQSGLTHGTVTDDSDIWLFGGKTVYRHVFNKKQFVHEYNSSLINNMLGLSREKLIQLALLVGCDYTVGVSNVGVISAIEILSEFSAYDDKCVGLLEKFKTWWEELQTERKPPGNNVRSRLANLRCQFPGSFPDKAIFKAFMTPNVNSRDYDKNSFQWNSPDVDGLRNFAFSTFGWSKTKTDDLLLPALKRFWANQQQQAKNQKLITNFAFNFQPRIDRPMPSGNSRFSKAVAKLKDNPTADSSAKTETIVAEDKKKRRKRNTKTDEKMNKTAVASVSSAAPKIRRLHQQRRIVSRKSKQLAAKKISLEATASNAALSSESD